MFRNDVLNNEWVCNRLCAARSCRIPNTSRSPESAARLNRLLAYYEFFRDVTFVVPDRNQGMRMVTRIVDTSVINTEDDAMIHGLGGYIAGANFRDSAIFINVLLILLRSNNG